MYGYYMPREIEPKGWLRRQLEIQADGLSGNLDKVWGDVRDSAWIGGDKEGWERVPYWLDGYIPLAWLLRDEAKMERARFYMDSILDRQNEDGWLCPCTVEERSKYDIWAHFLIGKVLTVYYECSGDERTVEALYRSMQCLYKLMQDGTVKLSRWGKARWFECVIPLSFLYKLYPEEWILDLAKQLRQQGADYESFIELWKRPLNKWTFETHIVNLGMMLKYEAVMAELFGVECGDVAERLWDILEQYNGTAVGMFSGDECLSGLDSNRGTELCSVAELMYTCEILYAVTGKNLWADRLERLAFNALPATISEDMWTHQYDQMTNQIACICFPGKSFFRTNNSESHLFGLEPSFGCCTANFNQAWPKLAWSIFRRTENGILAGMLLPSALHTTVGDAAVSVEIESDYPFRHAAAVTVTTDRPVRFALTIRVPAWAKNVTVDGELYTGGDIVLDREWDGTVSVAVAFTDTPHFIARPRNLRAVEYGALVYALPIETEYRKLEYEKNGVPRTFPYCDYELIPRSPWAFGFADELLTVCETDMGDVPFSAAAPRVTVQAKLAPVDWGYADGYDTVADAEPQSRRALGEAQTVTLIPYGAAKLRMTEMPMVEKD